MVSRHPLSERAAAAAAALLLQAALYLALSQRHPSLPRLENGSRLIAMILTAARAKRPAPPPIRASGRLVPVPVGEYVVVPRVTPAEPQRQASQSAFGWTGAIGEEVRKQETRTHAPAKLRFGFPQMPAEEGLPPAFGWDENRLNRVQRLAHGIIDLGDNCFISLWPPIAQCHSDSGNGDLFKHMHDPRPPDGPNTLP